MFPKSETKIHRIARLRVGKAPEIVARECYQVTTPYGRPKREGGGMAPSAIRASSAASSRAWRAYGPSYQ